MCYKTQAKKGLDGFRFIDTKTGHVQDVPLIAVRAALSNNASSISGIGLNQSVVSGAVKSKKDIDMFTGTNGSLDRYPALVHGKLISKNSIVILGTLKDGGYRVCNFEGKALNASQSQIMDFGKKVGIANGKIVDNGDGKAYISAISGTFESVDDTLQAPKISKGLAKDLDKKNNGLNNVKSEAGEKRIQQVRKNDAENVKAAAKKAKESRFKHYNLVSEVPLSRSKIHEVDPNTGLTVEQKLSAVMFALKATKPFYYSTMSTLNIIEADPETSGLDTMGVTFDKMYYSADFVKELSMPELMFVLIHEMCHLLMGHTVRQGERDHQLWNIATDLYINKSIAVEFGLTQPGVVVNIGDANQNKFAKITMLNFGLYISSLDVEKDIPEGLYSELNDSLQKEINKLKQSGQLGQSGQSQSGQGQSGQGQSGQGQSGQMGQSGQGQSSQGGQSGQSQGSQSGQGQYGQSGQNGGQSNQGQGQIGQQGNQQGQGQGGQPGTGGQYHEVDINLRGNKATVVVDGQGNVVGTYKDGGGCSGQSGSQVDPNRPIDKGDFILDKEAVSMSKSQAKDKARKVATRARQMHSQVYGGHCDSWIAREVELIYAPKVNWRTLVRNQLQALNKHITTYAAPDRRFIGRRQIMPGPKKVLPDALRDVVVAIDTSGSISQTDLGMALFQLKDMLKQFDTEAHMLYWDTEVRTDVAFKNVDEALSIKPAGGGGTDANCIFEYITSVKYKKAHKGKQPQLVIVFTDGYFGEIKPEFKTKFNSKTIWVVLRDTINGYKTREKFDAPFGKSAEFSYDD